MAIPRDWTLTDQAAEADDRAEREWWRADPFASHFAEQTEDEPEGAVQP